MKKVLWSALYAIRRKPTDYKYPNQELKGICTSLVMFIALMFGFHTSQVKNKNLLDHISACNTLLRHNKNISFLKQIMTDSEKWILYNNVEQKTLWGKQDEPPPTTPKASLHSEKVMVGLECLWWDWKEVLCCELFPESQTIPTRPAPNRPTERSPQQKASRISQQEMYNLPSG